MRLFLIHGHASGGESGKGCACVEEEKEIYINNTPPKHRPLPTYLPTYLGTLPVLRVACFRLEIFGYWLGLGLWQCMIPRSHSLRAFLFNFLFVLMIVLEVVVVAEVVA